MQKTVGIAVGTERGIGASVGNRPVPFLSLPNQTDEGIEIGLSKPAGNRMSVLEKRWRASGHVRVRRLCCSGRIDGGPPEDLSLPRALEAGWQFQGGVGA